MSVSEAFKHTVGKALGRIPSGVYLLTASHGGRSTVMMASWVQQAAFDPPAVSIAMAKGRPIAQLIEGSKRLVLSIIPQEDTSLMKRYARGIAPDEDPFAGVETFLTPGSVPAMKGALAWMECELIHTADFGGDHDLLIAEIVAGDVLREGKAFAHQRGNGFHY